MTAKEYQNILYPRLVSLFPTQQISNEWAAFKGLIYQYSPRVDIAVGPFNITAGRNVFQLYDELLNDQVVYEFLARCFAYHRANLDNTIYTEIEHPSLESLIRKNYNARCFIAVEIENRNSKKHIMGSIVNAASLGRIGIGVAFNKSTLRGFCRIVNYLAFLKRVDKNTYDVTNFLILTADQIDEICAELRNKYQPNYISL